ncbi:MAG: GntR family transcriptional regulator [Anaerolineales bacterium]|nr:GntR family transcriptional regulator [Anaerolineales bacterium]
MVVISENLSRSQHLHEGLAQVIAKTQPGGRLPSEPQLARQLGVSRASLREAMRTFETQGMVFRRQGVGTFVMHPRHVIDAGLESLESIDTMAKRIGLPVSMGEFNISHRVAKTDEVDALELQKDKEVLAISRVILVETQPVAYLVDILPRGLLTNEDLNAQFKGSILDLLLHHSDLATDNSRCEIQAVAASTPIARALGIKRGAVLLKFTSCLYTKAGRILDYSHSYFVPGYFRFHVMRRIIQYPI